MNFGTGLGQNFQHSEMTLNILLPFCTKYLCEAAFSALRFIKSKYWLTLQNVEKALCSAVVNIHPRFYLKINKHIQLISMNIWLHL